MSNVSFFIGGCAGTSDSVHTRPEFGGHTSSFAVITDEDAITIDNGSGVQTTSSRILELGIKRVVGLQTHFHNDHRIGLQNNPILFTPGLLECIYAPKLKGASFQDVYDAEFGVETWPVSPEMFGCKTDIREFMPGDTLSSHLLVQTHHLNHPSGGTVGYRIISPKGDVVIATDTEPVGEHAVSLARFISGAQIFYVDVQYRDREYSGEIGICGGKAMSRKDWGHGTPAMLKDVLTRCAVVPKHVVIGHHDPHRTDTDLRRFEREVQTLLAPLGTLVCFARDGDCIDL